MNLGDPLVRTINEAFQKAYPGELSPPVADEAILSKRVTMLIDDLVCTRTNWHAAEKRANLLEIEKRSIRWHWWQFWLPKRTGGGHWDRRQKGSRSRRHWASPMRRWLDGR